MFNRHRLGQSHGQIRAPKGAKSIGFSLAGSQSELKYESVNQGPHLIYVQVNWAMPPSVALIGWDPAWDPHKIYVGPGKITGPDLIDRVVVQFVDWLLWTVGFSG